MNDYPATALIAEDEPLLAAALQAELARAWPALRVLASVGDGAAAVAQALRLLPEVLFFDIRMPGLGGLEAAAELADEWPPDRPFPALVFVTAYDQYALAAFEAQAMDYLLKPVQPARLLKTVSKVQLTLMARAQSATNPIAKSGQEPGDTMEQTLHQLRQLLATVAQPLATGAVPLRALQVSVGNSIRMVPLDEVAYFEAADKYVRVLTAGHEYLIRIPLRELLPQLDPQAFWQVHRGTVVQASLMESVNRDESGRLSLSLRGRPERLAISRFYSHQFRAL